MRAIELPAETQSVPQYDQPRPVRLAAVNDEAITMPIRLHKFGDAFGLPDPSPFCLKLENFLREAGIDYTVEPFDPKGSFRKAPKGKIPFIEEENGTTTGDSTLIIARLSEKNGIDLDAPLDIRQRAASHACRRMLDEHFYWVGVYSRWFDEPGWSIVKGAFFSRVPWPVRPLLTAWAHHGMEKAMYGQGIGRHSRAEIYAAGAADLQALAGLLGTDAWFFGSHRPTLLDLWAHAFVAQIIVPPIESPIKAAALTHDNLSAHFRRLHDRLYPPS